MPPEVLAAVAAAVADLADATEPDLARRLREARDLAEPGGGPGASRKRARSPSLPDAAAQASQRSGDLEQLHWGLDPRLIPAGIFQHTLWPDAELTVRPERSRLIVEARLAPGADPDALAQCRARLVDPVNRSVLATARFRDLGDSRVRAEIRKRRPPREAWVEIVDDPDRPVVSAKLRHMRRAMRWADAALSAGRQTSRLADAEWTRLTAAAWGRCAEEWAAAGDRDRAYLAAALEVARYPGVEVRSEPPSPWAKELARASANGRAVPGREGVVIARAPGRCPGPGIRQDVPAVGSSITTTTRRLAAENPGPARLLAPCPTTSNDDRGMPLASRYRATADARSWDRT